MISIKRLNRPTRRSGNALAPLTTTKVRGLTITNTNKFSVYVDKFTRKPLKAKRKTKGVK